MTNDSMGDNDYYRIFKTLEFDGYVDSYEEKGGDIHYLPALLNPM